MCESNVYIREGNNEDLLMESVNIIRPEDGQIYLQSIFGEQKTVKAKIKELRLLEHKVILERP